MPYAQILNFEEFTSQEIEKYKTHGSLRIYSKNNRFLQFFLFKDKNMKKIYQSLLKQCSMRSPMETFAYIFPKGIPWSEKDIIEGWNVYCPVEEFISRQNLDLKQWSLRSDLNVQFTLCKTYPTLFVLPKVDDKIIKGSASFRSSNRLPVLTWADSKSCLFRSSQPCTGITGSRNKEDEMLLSAFRERSRTKKLFIIDCRPKANAIANTLMGKGYENTDFYAESEILFMNVENIHVMSESFGRLSKLGSKSGESNYLSGIDSTGWLKHISLLFSGSLKIVELLREGNAVLCHCSDGWDRTAQMCAIAQLLIDPYYRTIRGFEVLIEKEWISFGHRFSDRYDHFKKKSDQMSPIFVQFIDVVYHVWQQYPNEFEFNEKFLLTIVEQSYNCLFGNFLFNHEQKSIKHNKTHSTISLWTCIHQNLTSFQNSMYKPTNKVVSPDFSFKKLATQVWSTFYLYPGMRSKYQEMTSSYMKVLEKENNEIKTRLQREALARMTLENELMSTKAKIEEYKSILEKFGEEIITEKIEDEFTLLTRIENEPKVIIHQNYSMIENHFE